MSEPPDDVYVDAATASVRTEGVNDGYIASTARDEPFRAAVAVAYAAGRAHRLATLRELIDDLTDEDPCWFDHHGYCQAHGWMATDPACPHSRAKEIVAATGTEIPEERQ